VKRPFVLTIIALMIIQALAAADDKQPATAKEPSSHAENTPNMRFYAGLNGYARKVTTNSDEAQRWFDQGIQLLYGYNHDEAIRSFEQAGKIDPSCAMAWWGVAYARGLHINKPLMGEEQSRMAFEAAGRAVEALDNETPVEEALVHAVRQRYAWPVPKDRAPLDQKYAETMNAAWRQFPDDPDVGALYAESLMDLQPWDLWTGEGVPKGRTLEIAAVLERTLEKSPRHPGANHFYIHAIEASPWPQKGLEAAERLRDLVPGSGHLVHMPSHIYIRTGKYAEAAAANERAIKVDQEYFAVAPKPDFYSIYYLHNIHFLSYAAMMEGRYQTAIDAARTIEKTIPPDFLREYVAVADGFTTTALHVLIRFGKWEEILNEPEPEEWRLLSRAERHFARSVALSNLGRTDEAEHELELMDEVAKGFTDDWKMGNNPARDVVNVARKMAEGELAYKDGRSDDAFDLLREAVELEEQLRYDEPPGWMQPVRHALGALLLADGRAIEAEDVYRADLARHPQNAWSLLGLRQSLDAQGKVLEAKEMDEQVKLAWALADVKPMASCYCRPDARP
jgi:tetratricopeptide (TPR) repeat protein